MDDKDVTSDNHVQGTNMFTAMYNGLVLKHESEDGSNAKVSFKTADITNQIIQMFLLKFYDVNKNTTSDINNESASELKYSFQLFMGLDKHLNWLIDLNIEEYFTSITEKQNNNKIINMKKSKKVQAITYKKLLDKINSLHCLFTWNLQNSHSKKDLFFHLKKKYGNYNLDISLPIFTFERYISNIIIGYELFNKNKKETAKIVLLSIGKWLEELDKSTDEFYLLISDGLKYILKSTLAHMMITNLTENIQWLSDMIPFLDMNNHSIATVHAIQAAVLIEYGYDEGCFNKAVECVNVACDLDPNVPYWFYLHSLVLRAQRLFLLTYKSCPTENERSTIQQSILLSNVENIYFKYHEIMLLKDTILYDFYNHELRNEKLLCEVKKIVIMIEKLVCIEPIDPLILINCVKILRVLPTMAHNLNFEKQLLFKGLQLAPNDLIVLKAVVGEVIIHYKKKIKNNSLSEDQDPKVNKRAIFNEDLKFAVEKHNIGEDPIPHLTNILTNYDSVTQWKILAQICSYTILFNDNLKYGLMIFKMLVEAEENKIIHSDLILRHYSSFIYNHKKFNLAQLICDKIKIELRDYNDPHKELYYIKILHMILLKYDIDINVNRSMESYTISYTNNKKSRNDKTSKSNVNDSVEIININEEDGNYEDDSDHNNNENCCMCKIM